MAVTSTRKAIATQLKAGTKYPSIEFRARAPEDFEKQRRGTVLSRIATGDWDIVVVAHTSFKFLPIGTQILEGLPQTTIDYMVSRIPIGRMGTPTEVAALVHFLASAEASFTTGQCYDISGGRATY